ncbi:MAG TPA: hypothetical protein VJ691_08890, partial [Vicinamibacterales bacterium]|nr:hypothetical protein [Vicinamibacterales bacterium]
MTGGSSPPRRRSSDLDDSLTSRRSPAGADVAGARTALLEVADESKRGAELVIALEHDLDVLKRLADAKVVINASDAHQPNRGRQWAGLGLLTAAVVGIFALSATERRASSESLTELAGVEFPGTIGPSKRFALKSELNGTVKRVLVEVGDQVAVNQ